MFQTATYRVMGTAVCVLSKEDIYTYTNINYHELRSFLRLNE